METLNPKILGAIQHNAVRKILKMYAGQGLEPNELRSIAEEYTMVKIYDFDESRGVSVYSFIKWYLHNHLRNYVNRKHLPHRHGTDTFKRIPTCISNMSFDLQHYTEDTTKQTEARSSLAKLRGTLNKKNQIVLDKLGEGIDKQDIAVMMGVHKSMITKRVKQIRAALVEQESKEYK